MKILKYNFINIFNMIATQKIKSTTTKPVSLNNYESVNILK